MCFHASDVFYFIIYLQYSQYYILLNYAFYRYIYDILLWYCIFFFCEQFYFYHFWASQYIGVWESFYLLLINTKIINQYRLTYTLYSGLNRLQVYVTEIKEKQIFERIKVANMSTFWVRFLQIRSACGWMSDRCCGHFGSQRGSFQRNRHGSAICKKRSQKCGVATWFFQIFVFLLFLSHTYKPTCKSNFID